MCHCSAICNHAMGTRGYERLQESDLLPNSGWASAAARHPAGPPADDDRDAQQRGHDLEQGIQSTQLGHPVHQGGVQRQLLTSLAYGRRSASAQEMELPLLHQHQHSPKPGRSSTLPHQHSLPHLPTVTSTPAPSAVITAPAHPPSQHRLSGLHPAPPMADVMPRPLLLPLPAPDPARRPGRRARRPKGGSSSSAVNGDSGSLASDAGSEAGGSEGEEEEEEGQVDEDRAVRTALLAGVQVREAWCVECPGRHSWVDISCSYSRGACTSL
jgi:hypothetical protein